MLAVALSKRLEIEKAIISIDYGLESQLLTVVDDVRTRVVRFGKNLVPYMA